MQRVILVLAIIMTIVSAIGLGMFFVKDNNSTPVRVTGEDKQIVKKLSKRILIVKRDIKEGEQLIGKDIGFENVDYYEDTPPPSYYIDGENLKNIEEYMAAQNIKANSRLEWNNIVKLNNSNEQSLKMKPAKGMFSFVFPLDLRQYTTLEYTQPAEFVDIYFRYEVRSPRKEYGVAPKIRKDGEYSNTLTANTSSLVPIALHRRVLKNQKVVQEAEPAEYDRKEEAKGYLYVELTKEDIKKIVTVENLGTMYIFPAMSDKSGAHAITTENVISKEFIKELRGKGGQNEVGN